MPCVRVPGVQDGFQAVSCPAVGWTGRVVKGRTLVPPLLVPTEYCTEAARPLYASVQATPVRAGTLPLQVTATGLPDMAATCESQGARVAVAVAGLSPNALTALTW